MKCPFNGNFGEGHPYSETDAGPVGKAYGADQRAEARTITDGNRENMNNAGHSTDNSLLRLL